MKDQQDKHYKHLTEKLQSMLDEAGKKPCYVSFQIEGSVKDIGTNGIVSLMSPSRKPIKINLHTVRDIERLHRTRPEQR